MATVPAGPLSPEAEAAQASGPVRRPVRCDHCMAYASALPQLHRAVRGLASFLDAEHAETVMAKRREISLEASTMDKLMRVLSVLRQRGPARLHNTGEDLVDVADELDIDVDEDMQELSSDEISHRTQKLAASCFEVLLELLTDSESSSSHATRLFMPYWDSSLRDYYLNPSAAWWTKELTATVHELLLCVLKDPYAVQSLHADHVHQIVCRLRASRNPRASFPANLPDAQFVQMLNAILATGTRITRRQRGGSQASVQQVICNEMVMGDTVLLPALELTDNAQVCLQFRLDAPPNHPEWEQRLLSHFISAPVGSLGTDVDASEANMLSYFWEAMAMCANLSKGRTADSEVSQLNKIVPLESCVAVLQESLLPARLRAAICEIITHRYVDVEPHTDICEFRPLFVYSEIDAYITNAPLMSASRRRKEGVTGQIVFELQTLTLKLLYTYRKASCDVLAVQNLELIKAMLQFGFWESMEKVSMLVDELYRYSRFDSFGVASFCFTWVCLRFRSLFDRSPL
jgi:hypothetical protein